MIIINMHDNNIIEYHCPECNLTLTNDKAVCPFHNKKGKLKTIKVNIAICGKNNCPNIGIQCIGCIENPNCLL